MLHTVLTLSSEWEHLLARSGVKGVPELWQGAERGGGFRDLRECVKRFAAEKGEIPFR